MSDAPESLAIYRVGGSVRDELLGLPVQDRDWVVVGATPERMVERGFRPVGRDFPVFLHPRTHEEYALARTERKVGRGYRGFIVHCAPEVTLEEDLHRRDLTINAMARDEAGTLVDPWGGRRDLEARCLRHVSDAFAEDPVRILRLARFAARFPDFSVAPETLQLMRHMVASGEVDALVPERVWQELARGLAEPSPARMFQVLIECGALARILPELAQAWSEVPRERLLDASAGAGLGLAPRYASLCISRPDTARTPPLDQTCSDRLRVPAHCRDFARLATQWWPTLSTWMRLPAAERLSLLEHSDALRRPARALELAQWARTVGPLLMHGDWSIIARAFTADLSAARTVDAGAIAHATRSTDTNTAANTHAARIAEAVRAARIRALDAPRVPNPETPSTQPYGVQPS